MVILRAFCFLLKFGLLVQLVAAGPRRIPVAPIASGMHSQTSSPQEAAELGQTGRGNRRCRGRRNAVAGNSESPSADGLAGPAQHSSPAPQVNSRIKVRHWCFTAFETDDETVQCLKDWASAGEHVRYLVFGFEVCSQTLRPHLQGYVEVFYPKRLNWMRNNPKPNNWHWEPRRGSQKEAADYCKKAGEAWEFGSMATPRGGEEDTWAVTAQRIRRHARWEDVLKDNLLARFVCKAFSWAQAVHAARHEPLPFPLNLDKPGFLWQGKIARFILGTKADDRTIHWIYDSKGCRGKSKLGQFLIRNCGALKVAHDLKSLASMYDGQTIAIVDVPRAEQFANYEGLEQLKEAYLLQTKYEVLEQV
jgi:hypothetical protein